MSHFSEVIYTFDVSRYFVFQNLLECGLYEGVTLVQVSCDSMNVTSPPQGV